ncbi:MAG: 23S rRNA (uracil(1939)-C(5))-methyltransferase RlmD [Venatoribacter sp.]
MKFSKFKKPVAAKPASAKIELQVDALTSEGEGIARIKHDIYFVPAALPGEKVEVVLDGRRKKVWQTRLLKVLEASPDRIEPPCPHYKRCGGCDLQHLAYPAQVAFKQQRVEREFSRQGIEVLNWAAPLLGEQWHYRRKARVGVRFRNELNQNIVGFRERNSTHLTQIGTCAVLPQSPLLNWEMWGEAINALAARAKITQMEVVDADNALALVVRSLSHLSASDTEQLIAVITRTSHEKPVQLWLKESDQAAKLVWAETDEPLYHSVQGLKLVIQVDDFIQVNAKVNQAMIEQALAWLNPQKDEVIWDLFAGHGNFSMPLATQGARVISVEGSDAMAASLTAQAQSLGLPIEAYCADLTQAASLQTLPSAKAVLLDPPRAGAIEIMPSLMAAKIERILYVSCDAATLARDLHELVNAGYAVIQAGIMDMFPQTHHVETMVLLERKAK